MHPYKQQPPEAFWENGVTNKSMFDTSGYWKPKFKIAPKDNVATYGSCFAQYIGNNLKQRGFSWFRAEPAVFGMSPASLSRYGYELFSSRTGNIYTPSQLLQWTNWALEPSSMPAEVWETKDRFLDPFRPRIEPDGFESRAELQQAREVTCRAFRTSVEKAKYFIFTLGLTERWMNTKHGYEYPLCPGTAGGVFDKSRHAWSSMPYPELMQNLNEAIDNLKAMNPDIRIILTVSPVHLAATASENHVLVASLHAKALLRAVAGQAATDHEFVDYFPSYEIINNPRTRGAFFGPDFRSVNADGVNFVMDAFFGAQFKGEAGAPKVPERRIPGIDQTIIDDLVCEEELLFAFGDSS